MIEMAEFRPTTPPNGAGGEWVQLVCQRCRNGLGKVYLPVGGVVSLRCHHTIIGPDRKRKTCGWQNTGGPTR